LNLTFDSHRMNSEENHGDMTTQSFSPDSFQTFGDLLKYLRRRQRLTQLELSIAVGYSEAQIGRLEKNQRRPDLTALKALFIPALHTENEPELNVRFLELAESARQEEAPTPGVPPYKGLFFFDESDSELFFGREALTAHLAGHVMDLAMDASMRFLAVVGASGSGKSSLVRAGLAVALKRAGWDTRVFTPTINPLRKLEVALSPAHRDEERVLLLVDQFEEVFTLCHGEMERIAFIEKLLSSAQDPSKKTTVVIALRADFYSHCAQYPLLRQAVAAEQEYIGQMTAEELRRAIEEPAKRGGWEFEPGLVDILLNDIGAEGAGEPEPGALPLLSHALFATWEHRHGRTFTLAGYHASGGVRGAIAETAESVFTDQLNQTQRELARDVFLRLTELGEGTEDTRRRAALNELVRQSAEATPLRAVLNILAEARLITLNEDSAEVAHEALIREWGRLHEWLTQDREGLLRHRHLTESAREWEARGRDPAELYRGARLAQAREWGSTNKERLNASEQVFLAASLEQEQHDALEHEAQRQRELEVAQKLAHTEKARADENIQSAQRLRIRNRVITTVGTLALILALLASLFSVQSNRNADQAQSNLTAAQTAQAAAEVNSAHAETAQAGAEINFAKVENLRLSAEANAILAQNGDPEAATLLRIRALQGSYSIQADTALTESLEHLYNLKLFRGHTKEIYSVAFSPDGKYVLTGSQDGTARLWDAQSGQEIRQFIGHKGGIAAVTFSQDGTLVVTGGNDQTARVWDAESGQQLQVLNDSSGVTAVALSPDGKLILTNGGNKAARLWDVQSGRALRDFIGHTGFVSDVAFSADGQYALTGSSDTTARIWETATGKQLHIFTGQTQYSSVTSVAFSPDDKYVLAGNHDSTAQLWEVETGKEIQMFRGHTNSVSDVAFSPDGQSVLTASDDKTVRLWNIQSGQEVRRFVGHQASVKTVAFSPDGQYVLSGGLDQTARLWATSTNLSTRIFRGHTNGITSVAFSPDGKYALTGSEDTTARLWDVASGQEIRVFSGHTKSIKSVAFSHDGKYVLTGSNDNTARLWNTETAQTVYTLSGEATGGVVNVAFSPDNQYMLTLGVSFRGEHVFWDIKSGQKVRVFPGGPSTNEIGSSLAFTPDGKYLLSGPILFDLETGKEINYFVGYVGYSTALSPDGKYVLTGNHEEKTARLWDFATGQEIRTFIKQVGKVYGVAFSPDGKYALAGLANNIAYLWDVATGQELREFTGHNGPVKSVAFSPDGKYVLTGSDDGTAHLWDTDYHDTIRFACSLLWRDFTNDERTKYGITDNTPTCPKS
jgi:WD40 repeat protein/transcriptional regulator with XRE-family HTH domain